MLSQEQQEYHRLVCREMTKLALNHAIPVTYAPPIRTFNVPSGGAVTLPLSLGKIETASGCVLQLQHDFFVVTAEHVLDGYRERCDNGEDLDWQVGNCHFDPLPRVVWKGSYRRPRKDIVFLRITEQEALEACSDRTHIMSASTPWPPPTPRLGQPVLLSGFPSQLREIRSKKIGCGVLSAMLQVTGSADDGTFKCRFQYADLLSFNEKPLPVEEIRGCTGGVSGGPVFAVDTLRYPFVGVISQANWDSAFENSGTIVVESVEDIPSSFPMQ